MRNNFQKFLTSEYPPHGNKGIFAKTWKYAACMLLAFILGIGNVWAVDYSPLNYNGGSDLPSGYKYYGSSAGTENKSAFSITTYEGHTVFDVTAGGTGAYNKRAIEFTVSEDCTLDIEFYVGSDSRVLNLFHGNSTVVHSSKGTTKGDNEYTFSYSFEGITSEQTYSLSGSGSKVYISKITFTPAAACTETAPTSVSVSGGATYDKGDVLSNLSATVTGGSGTMSYQWYRNTADAATVNKDLKLANCTTATLTPSNKVGTYYYYCVASNCAGSVTSNTTAVTINANCSVTGDIFTLTMNTENAPTSEVKTPASLTMNIDMYVNIDGGDIVLGTGSSQHSSITTTPRIKLGGSSGYAQITLDCPLQEGDKITFEKTNKIALAADASGTNKIQLASATNEYLITKEDCLYNQSNLFILRDGNNVEISSITITRPVYRTITLEYADGVTPDGSLDVEDGVPATKPADPTWEHHRFDGWYNGETPYDWTANVTGDLTLTAHWTQLYTISFNNGGGSGDAPAPIADKAQGETFEVPENTFAAPTGQVFDYWNDGTNDYNPGDTYTVGTNNVTLTAVWRTPSTMYAITKGAHENGDFTIDPASQEAGEVVTLEATPDDGYLFGAWEVVKTEDASATGITVDANGQFTMQGYAVTVNATFVADPRKKILYVTTNDEATTKANDRLYEALKDDYRVTIVGPTSNADQTNYDLVVLHESIGGSNYAATAVAAAKSGSTPVLNTKSYFYNDGRWGWGTPNAGQSVKGATLNNSYCNIADHPLFDGVTMTAGFFGITDDAAAKCMQPVGSFTSGKEGYTLATSPNDVEGNGCAIHELTPAQRGASAGKYLMISVSNSKLDALNANGQKLFQNAAAYLIDGSASWTPIVVPTSPVVAATPTENYTEGGTITLTASAAGTSASTVYTWYKGADWATASATTPVQAASTSGATFSKTAAVEDAGTYWCNISNGTSCDAQASVTITVSSASTPTHTISYDNVKGADMTAYPTEYTEGIGVASFDPLADITGWHFVEWSPASIATDATTDQTITAVWAQVFEVTFNLQGHGAEIAKQDIIDGEKATKPADPVVIGLEFGGWFTDEECTAGNEFDFNTPITAATPLYAKWTAFDGCTLLVPATSGAAPAVEDPISMQTGSKGGSMSVVGTPLSYSEYGLGFDSNASAKAKVTINNEIQEGTVISLTLVANGTSARGLHLYTGDGSSKVETVGWTSEVVKYTEATFTYTVKATDVALIGSNEFQLWRNNSVYLKKLTVTNCGDPIVYHNLTSAVDPEGKGTVTLGATSVREGYTTTAEYSDIDPAYEFVNWTVSGEGASVENATANPATITVGTEDAVVTLNLKVKPVYYTVTYYDGASEMGTEQVAENGHPSATGITTKKLGYNFLGWSETDGGAVVELNNISITAAKDLYAKYEAVVCPTSGTVYKFQLKTDLTNGNVFATKPNSVAFTTDNYLSVLTGGILTGSIDDNNVNRLQFYDQKAVGFTSGTGGTLTIGLDCALAEGDVIKYINYASSGNKMTLSDATHTQTLDGNGTEEVQTWEVPAAWAGATELTLVRGGNTPKLTYFEIYRRPALTGVSLADLTIRQGQSKTPVMTLEPSADARVTSQVWEIVGTPTNLTGAAIDPATGAITTGTLDDPTSTGSISVKVTLNGSIEATCTATVVGNIDQQDVTKSTVWGWHNTGATANIQLTSSTDPKKNENFVLANVAVNNNDEFESDKLAVEGEYMVRDYDKTNPYFQGQLIQFHTTVAGVVRVKFAHTGTATAEKPARELYINGVATGDSRDNATPEWSNYIEVPAGDVSITAHYVNLSPVATQQYIRVFEIEFLAVGYERAGLVVGDLGTVCLPNASIARGVTVYEYQGADEIGKIVFDELGANELLVAGKPYIFQVNETNARFYYNTDPAVATEKNETALKGNLSATITFAPSSAEAANVYFVKDHSFWMAKNTGVKIGQYRCYLQMDEVQPVSSPNPAPGRRRITLGVQGEQVATGIDQVPSDQVPSDQVPSTKVIIDGHLYILRGEKMYDAKGQLVK